MNPATSTASLSHATSLPERACASAHPFLKQEADSESASSPGVTQLLTLVLWSGCVIVGALGFFLSYTRPHAPAIQEPAPVVVEKIIVDLRQDTPAASAAIPADPLAMPPAASALEQPPVAQPIAVAEASAVAFALPLEGPTTRVDASQASHSRSAAPQSAVGASTGQPAVQALVFGEGEGRQPAPEYPSRAMKLRQQGTVGVRLTVAPDGHVLDTSVAAPSPWPVLDEAATRTIRHRWHFSRGPVRVYEVAIRFALAN